MHDMRLPGEMAEGIESLQVHGLLDYQRLEANCAGGKTW